MTQMQYLVVSVSIQVVIQRIEHTHWQFKYATNYEKDTIIYIYNNGIRRLYA
jgi:hypothetical protein